VTSEPTNRLREWLGFTDAAYPDMTEWKATMHRLMNCALCSGFWIGLALTWHPGHAAIAAVAAELITRRITND
jgi:hypothetical protein